MISAIVTSKASDIPRGALVIDEGYEYRLLRDPSYMRRKSTGTSAIVGDYHPGIWIWRECGDHELGPIFKLVDPDVVLTWAPTPEQFDEVLEQMRAAS